MAFIDTVSAREAQGEVRQMYRQQQNSYGYVPHYATVFSHRPHVMKLWADLQYGIRRDMDKRIYELVTVASAMAIGSTYCSLAHGTALLKFYSSEEVLAIVTGAEDSPLSEAEREMMRFAAIVATRASETTAEDVARLKRLGFDDAEIFEIAATATARTFFAQLCEGLGAIGDHPYEDMMPSLRSALTVGRGLEHVAPERLPETQRESVPA